MDLSLSLRAASSRASTRSDAEVGVELADAVGLEAGDAQHGEHAFRGFLAHRLQLRVLSGLVEFGDDGGDGVADAGDFRQPAFFDQAVERLGAQGQVFGGAGIGARTVRVAAFQLHALAELPQHLRNCGGIRFCHVLLTVFRGFQPNYPWPSGFPPEGGAGEAGRGLVPWPAYPGCRT